MQFVANTSGGTHHRSVEASEAVVADTCAGLALLLRHRRWRWTAELLPLTSACPVNGFFLMLAHQELWTLLFTASTEAAQQGPGRVAQL